MEIYLFVHQILAWSITVAVLQPLMIPWAWAAYRIWHGNKPIDEDLVEALWLRATLASLAVTAAAVVFLLCDWATVTWLEMKPNAGAIHVVYYVSFLTLSAWLMMYLFSIEDYFGGLSMIVIYLYIPTAILFALNLLFANPLLVYVLQWLEKPTA